MGAFLLYGCVCLYALNNICLSRHKQALRRRKMRRERFTHAIFGFKDKETGEKLRQFFKKHTGKDIDFNQIQHYKDGFKLLLFSIPLNTIERVGITAAGCAPSSIKRFSGLNEFIGWYEGVYLKEVSAQELEEASMLRTIDHEFSEKFKELDINIEYAFAPFPKMVKFEPLRLPQRGEAQATILLPNGLYARVPFDRVKQDWLIMTTNICTKNGKINWKQLLNYLEANPSKKEEENMSRLTPDDNQIRYKKKYDKDFEYICNYINYNLNVSEPFDYPKNWFDVAKILRQKRDGPLGCDGVYILGYMFAAPRNYLHYFKNNKSDEEIALDIFYDNC